MGQRHFSLLNSKSEQRCWLSIVSSMAGGASAYNFLSIWYCIRGTDLGRFCARSSLWGARRGFFSRVKFRRFSLPITALRLTPMASAISRQDSPAAKWLFRSSMRSTVQVGSVMSMVPRAVSRRPALPLGLAAAEPGRPMPLRRLAVVTEPVVADRKQPVFNGEPNAFFNQGSCDAGYAGAVGALSDQFFEIGNGRERQRNRNAVGFGF